jgi:drug/metabolite transporter (DMT)-like permease
VAPRSRRLLPWLSLLVIWVVWGSTYMAIRIVVRSMPPFAAASLRFLVAGMVMAGAAALIHGAAARPTAGQLRDYAFVGALLLGIGNGCVMWAEQTIPSGIAALVVATVPLWITLAEGVRGSGQAFALRRWIGVLVGLVGVALVARPEGAQARQHLLGIVALQAGALSWTVGSLYAQAVKPRPPLATVSAIEMLAGSLLLLAESRIAGEELGRFAQAPVEAWLGLGYLAAFGSLLGFTAFAYCLNELPAATVGTYAYVNPVVAVALGAAFLGEPLSLGLLSGGALIVVAVLLTTLRPEA